MKQLVLEAINHLPVKGGEIDFANQMPNYVRLGDFIRKQFGLWLRGEAAELYALVSIQKAGEKDLLKGKSGRLSEVLSDEQRNELAERVTEFWAGVPYQYDFVFPLAAGKSFDHEYRIAPGMTCANVPIAKIDRDGLRFGLAMNKHDQSAPALIVRERGLMMLISEGEVPVGLAIRKAKITLLLGKVEGVFGKAFLSFGMGSYVTFTPSNNADAVSEQVNIPANFMEPLARFSVRPQPADELPLSFSHRMRRVGHVLSRLESSEGGNDLRDQCERIATSAEWLFDAEHGPASAMTFLQAAISLDALYGADEKEPVLSTLSNRVAYALGRTAKERADLRLLIGDMYNTRSKVVHRGISQLQESERHRLDGGIEIAERALVHELKLVEAAAES